MNVKLEAFQAHMKAGLVPKPVILELTNSQFYILDQKSQIIFCYPLDKYSWIIEWRRVVVYQNDETHQSELKGLYIYPGLNQRAQVRLKMEQSSLLALRRLLKGRVLFSRCPQTHLEEQIIYKGRKNKVSIVWDTVLNERFVCKVTNYNSETDKQGQRIFDEAHTMRILTQMPHINLLQLEEVGIDDTSVHIVTKPFSGGTLANLISRKGKGSFQKCEIQYILDQLLQGLSHLHKLGFVHKDIKLDNIFVSEDDDKPHVVLGDFGYTAHKDMCYKKLCGTPGYLAPEILEHGEIDEKSDIFSTGIIFHILLVGRNPLYDTERRTWSKSITFNAKFSEHLESLCEDSIDLVTRMLDPNPETRPTAQECLKHRFFSNSPYSKASTGVVPSFQSFTAFDSDSIDLGVKMYHISLNSSQILNQTQISMSKNPFNL